MSHSHTRTATRGHAASPVTSRAAVGALLAVAAVLLLISPLGLGWMFVPANPAAKTPAMTLSFGELKDVVGSGMVPTNGLQEAYFEWLAWTLIIVTVGLSLALVVTRNRLVAYATAVAGALGLLLTVLAMKGPQTWGQFWDQSQNVRIGGYVLLAGFLIALGTALASAARRA